MPLLSVGPTTVHEPVAQSPTVTGTRFEVGVSSQNLPASVWIAIAGTCKLASGEDATITLADPFTPALNWLPLFSVNVVVLVPARPAASEVGLDVGATGVAVEGDDESEDVGSFPPIVDDVINRPSTVAAVVEPSESVTVTG